MLRKPQAAERCSRGQGAPNHSAGEARLQQVRAARAPSRDVVDFKGHADTQEQRQRDDVGEIERHADQDTNFQRHNTSEQKGHKREQDVAKPPQDYPQQNGD